MYSIQKAFIRISFSILAATLLMAHAARGDQVIQVAAGKEHSLFLTNDGSVWAWGDNTESQVKDGTKDVRPILTPKLVREVKNAVQIAAGHYFSAAILKDGSVVRWGGGIKRPTAIPDLRDVTQISGGKYHLLALLKDGTVKASGANARGQLGDGTNADSVLTSVKDLSNVIYVFAREEYSLAIKKDGSLWAWGNNSGCEFAEEYRGGTCPDLTVPAKLGTVADAVQIVAEIGQAHNQLIVLNKKGETFFKDYNPRQGLPGGLNKMRFGGYPETLSRLAMGNGNRFLHFEDVSSHLLLLDPSNKLFGIGNNIYGQLGQVLVSSKIGGWTFKDFKPEVYGQTGVVDFATGAGHSLSVKKDGSVWGWGLNEKGQVGNGTKINQSVPVQIYPVPVPTSSSFPLLKNTN